MHCLNVSKLKLKELRELKEGVVDSVIATEALVNTLSNNMYFVAMEDAPKANDIELQVGLIVRTKTTNKVYVYEGNHVVITNPVLKNPFIDVQGYFLYMYSLQHLLDKNYKFNLEGIRNTIMYPTLLTYEDGAYILIFTLFVDSLDELEGLCGQSILNLKNKDTFTCGNELDKIVLATQKLVVTKK